MTKKVCEVCNKEEPEFFFINEMCIACAAKAGVTAEAVKSKDYEEVSDKGCAGGACTL